MWEDNQKFIFEKYLLNEDLINFFINYLEQFETQMTVPVEQTNNAYYYQKYQSIPASARQTQREIIKMIHVLIFDILMRLQQSNPQQKIQGLFKVLKKMFFFTPEFVYEYLSTFALKEPKFVLEQLISSPNQVTRETTSQLLATCVNTVVCFYSLDLDKKKYESFDDEQLNNLDERHCVEFKLLRFLNTLHGQLHIEVEKNYYRFEEYFKFWYQFYIGGESQSQFMFQNKFLEVYCHFMMENEAPLNYSPKNHKHLPMGNQYRSPDFTNVAQVIYQMFLKTQQKVHPLPNIYSLYRESELIPLSLDQKIFLYSYNFHKKLIEYY